MRNKLNLSIFLIIILTFISTGCGDRASNYEKAKKFFKAGDFKNAIILFEKNVESKDVKGEAFFYLAICYEKSGNYENSIKYYNKIFSEDFSSPLKENEDFMNKIKKELQNTRIKYAYDIGIKGDIKNAQIILSDIFGRYELRKFHLGVIAYKRKEYRKAIGLFQSALNSRGENNTLSDTEFVMDVYYNMAILYYDLYKVTREEKDIYEAFRHVRLSSNLALDPRLSKTYTIRINELKEKIKLLPVYIEKYKKIDIAYDEMKIAERGEEWKKVSEKAIFIINNSPINDDILYSSIKAGDAFYYLNDKDNSLKYYKKALDKARGIKDFSVTDLEERVRKNLKKLGFDL